MASHDDWNAHWDRYASAASQNPAQRMRHDLIARLLRKGARDAMRLFDIGSGQGDMLAKLRPIFPSAEFFGAELSASGVEMSRSKVPDATFLTADLFAPPPEIARFQGWATDAVCSEVLEHVDDPAAFLRAACPYLADGARLVVTVPGGPMSEFDKHIGHRQHFTRASIARVLEDGGFTAERVHLAGFPFFNLYRAAVIARGKKLVADGESKGAAASVASSVALAVFRFLFHFNLSDSPFGWQVVAVARKS